MERVVVSPDDANIRLRTGGLTHLLADPRASDGKAGGQHNERAQYHQPRPTVTVRLPTLIRWSGGRKLVLAPDDAEVRRSRHTTCRQPTDKAIARAFRWREMLESD